MERFKLYLINNPSASIEDIVDELRNIQTMESLRPADRLIIYLGAVFTPNFMTKSEIKVNLKVLKALAPSDIQQRHLIAAFEWLCGTKYPQLLDKFSIVLMQLYDEELVEEDVFLAWAGDNTRNEFTADPSMMSMDALEQLKLASTKFITWLQEADDDEEEGEEDDDEEEEEEEGSQQSQEEATSQGYTINMPIQSSSVDNADEDEDIDIDNI